MKSNWLDRAANLAIVAAALAVSITVGQRELARRRQVAPVPTDGWNSPSFVPEWREIGADGLEIGPAGAPVQITVFTDLECPFCARFHLDAVTPVMDRHTDQVRLTVVHLPIKSHRFAMQSATALECAAAEGKHARFLEVVYRQQDSIGLKPWNEYARAANVSDTLRFLHCLASSPPPRIAAGKRWADRLRVAATPTVLVNGWRYGTPPSEQELTDIVGALVAGKNPFDR